VTQKPIVSALQTLLLNVEHAALNKGDPRTTHTGYRDFDGVTLGLLPNDLAVIAGRPTVGKTSYVLGLAVDAATTGKKSVLYFSTDQSAQDLTRRALASIIHMDPRMIVWGKLSKSEWERAAEAAHKLSESDLNFVEESWLSIAEIRKRCEEHITTAKKLDLVVIDKFHSLILGEFPETGSQNRRQELFNVGIELKALARDFDIPVVLVCDINKGVEERHDKRPRLVDLKDESAVLESYADIVTFLYRTDDWDPEYRNIGEVIIAKSRRYDGVATARMKWIPRFAMWANMDPGDGGDGPGAVPGAP
jgi:replicative DNA helicase